MRASKLLLTAIVAGLSACGGPPAPSSTERIPAGPLGILGAAPASMAPPEAAPCNGPACEKACRERRDAAACTRRAAELEDRMDAGLLAEVVDLLASGCEGRDGQACMELAVHCGRDIALPTCLKAGVALLPPSERVACSASGADGISECREHARSALFRQGYTSGEKDCARGIASACFIVAYSHEVGYGHGDHDTTTALLWYRRGCDAGDADSCGSLAVVLRRGSEDGSPGSVPEADSAEFRALELREERCEAGDALVCFNLARSFESGQFPAPIDPERAALLEAKACKLGLDHRSCP